MKFGDHLLHVILKCKIGSSKYTVIWIFHKYRRNYISQITKGRWVDMAWCTVADNGSWWSKIQFDFSTFNEDLIIIHRRKISSKNSCDRVIVILISNRNIHKGIWKVSLLLELYEYLALILPVPIPNEEKTLS